MDTNEPEQNRKLIIAGLGFSTTEESLKHHFAQWGEILDVIVMKDPETRRSRGFAFITFSRAYMVDDVQNARPHHVDGREVESKRVVAMDDTGKPEVMPTVRKIFVGGLEEDIEEDELRDYFKSYGTVTSVVLVTAKDTGKKTGVGFVEFDDYDPVDKVVLAVKSHELRGKPISVKIALDTSESEVEGNSGSSGDSHNDVGDENQ